MNQGRPKVVWTWFQRHVGARWIELVIRNRLQVRGLEHVEAVSSTRPILLAANHRSFFDLYVVSSVLFRRTRRPMQLFFPVRGRYFYQSPAGMLINFLMAWWSMYPPFFAAESKRAFDQYSIRLLIALCRSGAAHVIGFHPEGTRNRSPDPYSYLRPQPGVGKLIREAAPQVVPVFVTGLGNNLVRQVLANWRGGEPVRVYFGPVLDCSPYLELPNSHRTHRTIAELVMDEIAKLGEQDRMLLATRRSGQEQTA